jgi:hypothetical protein
MSLGKRPGGLTALAVLNFVFGGFGAIGALLGFAGLSIIRKGIQEAEAAGLKYDGQSLTGAYLVIGLTALAAVLLIASGVGYLKQTKTGRTLGNMYALTSIAGTVVGVVTGGGVGALTILFSIYPLLTLILINSSFKAHLDR